MERLILYVKHEKEVHERNMELLSLGPDWLT